MSRIIGLEIENVKRLSAVHIKPKRSAGLVLIGGRNGQGKTSVLDSIGMALGGANEVPLKPIREGETQAKTVLEIEDLIITRRFTASGSTLVVANREGMKASAPQSILDKLTGKLSFDPVAFMRLDAGKQREALRKLVNVDFSEDDKDKQILFNERTDVNRDLNSAAAVLHSMANYLNAPTEEISVAETAQELENAQNANQLAKELTDAVETAQGAIMENAREIDMLVGGIAPLEQGLKRETDRVNKLIADLQEGLKKETDRVAGLIAEVRKSREAAEGRVAELKAAAERAEAAAMQAPTFDITPIREKLAGAEAINAKVRANAARAAQQKKVDELNAKSLELTASIEKIEARKKKKLQEAKFPVAGLCFDETGVTFGGVPLSQASAAEQLRISVAMAASLNPKLRVMLVRDGSLLDEDSLALLEQLAHEHDLQVWVERVGKADKTAVIIEDGTVWERAETAETPAA